MVEARPGGTRRADSYPLTFAAVSVGAAGLVKIERQDFLLISFSRFDCLRRHQRDQPESPLLPFLLYFGICLLVEIFSHSSSGTTESPRLHGGTRFAILSRRPLLEATWAKTAKLTGRGEEKERFRQLGIRQFPLFVLLLGNPHNFQQFTVARSKVQFADPPFTTGLKR